MLKRIKKIFSKIKKNLRCIKKNLKYIHKKNNLNYFIIFIDAIICHILYGISIDEYRIYEFYKIDSNNRNTYLSLKKHNSYKKYFFNKKIANIINNKEMLFKRLEKYLDRKVLNVSNISLREFEDFISNNKTFLARDKDGVFLNNYKYYNKDNFRSNAFLLDNLKKDKNILVEKVFDQANYLNNITDNLIVFNIITMFNNKRIDVITGNVQYKKDNHILTAFLDLKNKCINGYFKDEEYKNYNNEYVKLGIKEIDEIINKSVFYAKELSEFKEIRWSFCITNNNTYLVDASEVGNDIIFAQIKENLKYDIGLKNYYKRIIKKMRKN